MSFNLSNIRNQFPILDGKIGNYEMVYLDNAATSQTPHSVVKCIEELYETNKANVHRGVHTLSQEATALQEATRTRVKEYINASSIEEIIFTRGTTEAINLVAASYGQRFKKDDEIILTVMEHHANIVPWQLLRDRTGIIIKVVDINDRGELNIDQYKNLFTDRTVFASFCHVSNVLGTINPIKEMIEYAHSKGVPVLIDGAQASPHLRIDVKELDCDFYTFSSHKMYGPTGIGILYGKKDFLERMPPYQGGGEMIRKVTFEHTTFADLPYKFEAGTPDFIGIAAFIKALEFMDSIGLQKMAEYENHLLDLCTSALEELPDIKIFGTASHKSSVISFLKEGVHPYDIGMLLDKLGICVRTGHHCAQPLMDRLGIPGTVRVSFAVYNTEEEIIRFIEALHRIIKMF